jgi:hypothetical protein
VFLFGGCIVFPAVCRVIVMFFGKSNLTADLVRALAFVVLMAISRKIFRYTNVPKPNV